MKTMFNKQSGFALPIAILIAVVLIVAAGAVSSSYISTSYKTYPIKKPEMVKSEQAVNETADWNVYQNEEYGFEMKYSKDWESKERSLMSNLGQLDSIWLKSNEDSFSVDVWNFSFYSYDQLTEPPPGGTDPDIIVKKEIIIDDQPAIELSYIAVGDGDFGAREIKKVFIQKNQLLYIISYDSGRGERILSTFKFI